MSYSVFLTPSAWTELKNLPGNVRQRVRRAIDGLELNPRPAKSKKLDVPDLPCEDRRLRLDRWRVLYAITEAERTA